MKPMSLKKVFPNQGLNLRAYERSATSEKIVARRKKHGGEPAPKHARRAAE